MGRKASVINLTTEEREYLETQVRVRTIQAQTVKRSRILLLKADGYQLMILLIRSVLTEKA